MLTAFSRIFRDTEGQLSHLTLMNIALSSLVLVISLSILWIITFRQSSDDIMDQISLLPSDKNRFLSILQINCVILIPKIYENILDFYSNYRLHENREHMVYRSCVLLSILVPNLILIGLCTYYYGKETEFTSTLLPNLQYSFVLAFSLLSIFTVRIKSNLLVKDYNELKKKLSPYVMHFLLLLMVSSLLQYVQLFFLSQSFFASIIQILLKTSSHGLVFYCVGSLLYYDYQNNLLTFDSFQSSAQLKDYMHSLILLLFVTLNDTYSLYVTVWNIAESNVYYLWIQTFFIILLTLTPVLVNMKTAVMNQDKLKKKLDLIRYICHEMRTPLNVAKLGAEVVNETLPVFISKFISFKDSQQNGSFVDKNANISRDTSVSKFKKLARQLSSICLTTVPKLDAALDSDKLEEKKLVLEKTQIENPSRTFFHETVLHFKNTASIKNIKLRVIDHIAKMDSNHQNVELLCDKNKVSNIIGTVVANAITYTPAGGEVKIEFTLVPYKTSSSEKQSVECCPDMVTNSVTPLPTHMIRISVTDHVNVPQPAPTKSSTSTSTSSKSFGSSYKNIGNDRFNDERSGSELALSVGKKIIELHGGNMTMLTSSSSSGNKNSYSNVFSIDLPVTVALDTKIEGKDSMTSTLTTTTTSGTIDEEAATIYEKSGSKLFMNASVLFYVILSIGLCFLYDVSSNSSLINNQRELSVPMPQFLNIPFPGWRLCTPLLSFTMILLVILKRYTIDNYISVDYLISRRKLVLGLFVTSCLSNVLWESYREAAVNVYNVYSRISFFEDQIESVQVFIILVTILCIIFKTGIVTNDSKYFRLKTNLSNYIPYIIGLKLVSKTLDFMSAVFFYDFFTFSMITYSRHILLLSVIINMTSLVLVAYIIGSLLIYHMSHFKQFSNFGSHNQFSDGLYGIQGLTFLAMAYVTKMSRMFGVSQSITTYHYIGLFSVSENIQLINYHIYHIVLLILTISLTVLPDHCYIYHSKIIEKQLNERAELISYIYQAMRGPIEEMMMKASDFLSELEYVEKQCNDTITAFHTPSATKHRYMKNPLIKSSLNLLEYMNGPDTNLYELLHEVLSCCKTSEMTLEEFTILNEMEDKEQTIKFTNNDPFGFLTNVADSFKRTIKAANITYHMDLKNSNYLNRLSILCDEFKLSQVIRNLLSNALKFTPAFGNIHVNLEVIEVNIDGVADASSSIHPMKIRIHVRDSGAGISIENQKKMFGKYVQFNAAKLQAGKGSGLGLWISKQIVELHGGSLTVYSEGEGLGSTFTVELPAFERRRGKSLSASSQYSSCQFNCFTSSQTPSSVLSTKSNGSQKQFDASIIRRNISSSRIFSYHHLKIEDGGDYKMSTAVDILPESPNTCTSATSSASAVNNWIDDYDNNFDLDENTEWNEKPVYHEELLEDEHEQESSDTEQVEEQQNWFKYYSGIPNSSRKTPEPTSHFFGYNVQIESCYSPRDLHNSVPSTTNKLLKSMSLNNLKRFTACVNPSPRHNRDSHNKVYFVSTMNLTELNANNEMKTIPESSTLRLSTNRSAKSFESMSSGEGSGGGGGVDSISDSVFTNEQCLNTRTHVSSETSCTDADSQLSSRSSSGMNTPQLHHSSPAVTPPPPLPTTTSLPTLRILIVDDSKTCRYMTRLLLRLDGYTIFEATDGLEAVELCKTNTYDIILSDDQMTHMSGPVATAQLRHNGYKGVIVGLTGNDNNDFMKNGADVVLMKPLDSTQLKHDCLEKHFPIIDGKFRPRGTQPV